MSLGSYRFFPMYTTATLKYTITLSQASIYYFRCQLSALIHFGFLNLFIKLFLWTTKINLKFVLYGINIWLASVIYQDCLHRENIRFTAKFEVGIDVFYFPKFQKWSELGSQDRMLSGTRFLKQHTCSAQSTCSVHLHSASHTNNPHPGLYRISANDYGLT